MLILLVLLIIALIVETYFYLNLKIDYDYVVKQRNKESTEYLKGMELCKAEMLRHKETSEKLLKEYKELISKIENNSKQKNKKNKK